MKRDISDEITASPARQPGRSGGLPMAILRSLRPQQYVKNLLVFAALVFSGHFFVRSDVLYSLSAFTAVCLCASAAYLYNDIRDREADRQHPIKRLRPIASGALPMGLAAALAVLLIAGGLGLAFSVNRLTGLTVLAYVGLTTSYSLVLKHIVIVDVLSLASGFVLRVIIGAEAIQVEFSTWLVLCTFLLALFLGFGKRRHELTLLQGAAQTHRKSLSEYSPQFLDNMMSVVTAGTMMSYVLYTMDPLTLARFHQRPVIYTSVFVLYGIFRYLYLIHLRGEGGNPSQTIYLDRGLQLAALLWAASVVALRYL